MHGTNKRIHNNSHFRKRHDTKVIFNFIFMLKGKYLQTVSILFNSINKEREKKRKKEAKDASSSAFII
jgi:hypothetical protein